MTAHAVLVTVVDEPGILFGLTKVFADHHANVTHLDT
jgi:glycine cleavage system regulatory protein